MTTRGIYDGNDGGKYYIHEVDGSWYWFGETADGAIANVFVGQRTANTVRGNWYDVPKGGSARAGVLVLGVDTTSGAISRIEQSGGFVATAWHPIRETLDLHHTKRPSPVDFRRARYQGDAIANLTGTWRGSDASNVYVRELDGTVVWIAESSAGAHVFSGTLGPNRATLQGTWATVPKLETPVASGQVTFEMEAEMPGVSAARMAVRSGTMPLQGLDRVEALDVVVHLDHFTIEHDVPSNFGMIVAPPVGFVPEATAHNNPYLWTFFALIDGHAVIGPGASTESNLVRPYPRVQVISPPGSHASLGKTSVPVGTIFPIPSQVGRFAATLMSVRGLAPVTAKSSTMLLTVAVALDNNGMPEAAMEAGHQALTKALEDKIQGAVGDAVLHGPPDDATLAQWTDTLKQTVLDAVKKALSPTQAATITAGITQSDAMIGMGHDLSSYTALEAAARAGRKLDLVFQFPPDALTWAASGGIDVVATPLLPVDRSPAR